MNNLSNELVPTERLQKIASWREKYGNGHNVMIPAEEAELMAREILAYREAQGEPVAYIDSDELERLAGSDSGVVRTPNFGVGYQSATIPLFTAPQSPVWFGIDWAAVPATHPATDDMALAFCRAISDNSVGSDEIEEVKIGLRAALANYSTPQIPAVPDGWALVPLEATPEMLGASWIHHDIHAPNAWRTMVAAAPKPEVK